MSNIPSLKSPVTLFIKEFSKPREISSFSMKFDQSTDGDGQVAAIPRGGKITMKMKALNDGSPDMVCWMIAKNQTYSGHIEFLNTTDGKLMKTYYFSDAYCVDYHEWWEDPSGLKADAQFLTHWEQITISCRSINDSSGSMKFKNNWELVE